MAKCVFTSTAVVSAFAFALMVSIPRQPASGFADSSEIALLDLSAHALRLFSVEFFFWWFGFAAQRFFNAIQKPKNAAILTISTAIVFPLLMVVLLWPLKCSKDSRNWFAPIPDFYLHRRCFCAIINKHI